MWSRSLIQCPSISSCGRSTYHSLDALGLMRNLQVRLVPIDQLIPYIRNSRTHTDAQVALVAASIREFGWTNPILVRPDLVVIAGHARLLAARKLGLTEVPVIELSGLE